MKEKQLVPIYNSLVVFEVVGWDEVNGTREWVLPVVKYPVSLYIVARYSQLFVHFLLHKKYIEYIDIHLKMYYPGKRPQTVVGGKRRRD